jgi:hypothetical protein
MREPTYRDALSHSWQLLTQHKVLWIFGLFAALLGQLGIIEILSKVIVTAKYYTYYPLFVNLPAFLKAFSGAMQEWNLPLDKGVWFVWLLVILLSFAFLFVFVAVVSQGALIHSIAQYVRGKTKLEHHESWHAGVWHFGRLLSLQIIKKLCIGVLVLFTGFATYNFVLNPSIGNTTFFSFALLVSIFFGSIISLLTTYAAGYVVVEEFHVRGALQSAWRLLQAHGLVSVELALISLLVNIISAITALLVVVFFRIEIFILSFLSLVFQSVTLWSLGNTFTALLTTGMLMVIASFVTVFTTAMWTYVFMKMHRDGVPSRTKLFFRKVFLKA